MEQCLIRLHRLNYGFVLILHFVNTEPWTTYQLSTYLQEASRGNHNHEPIGKVANLLIQCLVAHTPADASTSLECMRHQHPVVGEEFAPLDNVMASPAEEGGANDTNDFCQEIIVLLQGTRVLHITLQLRVGREETASVNRAEEVGIEDVFGAVAGLGHLEEQRKTGVLVVLLIRVAWWC